MIFLNLCDYVESKMTSKKTPPLENQPFLPTTVTRFEIPERKPGYPWMELYCALVAATSFLCCGIIQSYTSGAIYSIQTDVEAGIILSQNNISWIASAPPLAALLGTVLVGPMMEKLGRKRTITLLSIPFIAGWLIIGFAVNFTMILIGRLVTGLAFGMARAVAPLYVRNETWQQMVSETARSQHRGKLGYLPPIMSAVGVLVGCMLGTWMNWKQLAIMMAFFPALLLLSSLYLPETPHWLISQNQEDQAFQALKTLRHRRGNVNSEELRLYKEIREIRETVESRSVTAAEYDHIHEEESMLTLLQQPYLRRPAILVFLLMIFQQFSGVSAIIYYMKMILNHVTATATSSGGGATQQGPPLPPPQHHLDMRPTIVGIVHICAFFITLPLVDRLGRKILLIISGILMALSHLLLAFYFFIYSVPHFAETNNLLANTTINTEPFGVTVRRDVASQLAVNNMTGFPKIPPSMSSTPDDTSQLFSSVHSWLPLLSLCAYIASFSLASPVPYILMSEMFSLTVRGYLCSAATLISSISSFTVIFLFPRLMYGLSPVITFVVFALFSLQTSLLGFIIPETKGKSLAEIENLFRGPRDFRGKVKATIEVPECAILDVAMEVASEAKSQISRF